MNALAAALLLLASEPPPATDRPAGPTVALAKETTPTPTRGFVYAWWAGVTLGVPYPSFSPVTAFFGGRLPSGWALGYQLGLSVGGAERYLGSLLFPMAHRHHIAGMRRFGAKRRGLVTTSGGVAFVFPLSPVVEVETRVAVRLGGGKWHFGGLLRLGWDVGHREYAPMPQVGIYIGLTNL